MSDSADSSDTKVQNGLCSYGYTRVPGPEKKRLVLQHFDHIAARYDLADALLSFGLHFRWRRFALKGMALGPESRILDLCGGTGDFASMIANRPGSGGLVLVCDMNKSMLDAGRKKLIRTAGGRRVHWVQSDAEELGFPDGCFDLVTIGFGLRNLVHLEKGLREILRVLKKAGKILVLEFSVPIWPWFKTLYHLYSFEVMPFFGKVITGKRDPFQYLAESVRTFSPPEEMAARLEAAGFRRVRFKRLTNGIVTIYFAEK